MMGLGTLQTWGIVVASVVGLGLCSLRDREIETRGAAKVTSAIAQQTEKINAKANAARAAARKPGSADRVREWCRDCDG
jgi:hypothetical protein